MFVVGRRYRVWYSDGRLKRAFVGTHLGTSYAGEQFDLRPEAGTITLAKRQIDCLRPTTAPHREPRRVEDIPSVVEDESTGYICGG